MTIRRLLVAACAVLVAAPGAAFAHGGSYAPPAGGQPPSGPQVPPGTADPPSPVTHWETWWAANKEAFLRLGESMREQDGPTSRGLDRSKPKPEESPQAVRERRDAAVREALAPVLLEALGDDSFEVRTAAAIALGKSGAADASRPLREASEKDAHKDVRDAATLGLGLLGRAENIPFLDGVLRDPKQNTRHRSFAAFGLGLIGGEDAAASLLSFADGDPGAPARFQHEQPELVASTFVAMGLTGDDRVLPVLRQALGSSRYDDAVRAFVVLSLGRMGDRESIGVLGRMLVTEKDAGLRRSAAIAVGRIARPQDSAAVAGLVSAVRGDGDLIVRQFAAVSLGGIGGGEVTARLEKFFADTETPQAARPFVALALGLARDADAVPMLRSALAAETDESAKGAYCLSLGLIGDPSCADLVEKQLAERGRFWLQGYAALALGMMKHTPSADLIYRRLTDENDPRLRANLSVALGLLHDPRARTYLLTTLRRDDATLYERGGAAMAMGVLRMGDTFMEITEVYRNKKEQDLVRAFSVVALGLIADPSPYPKLARYAIDNNYTLSVDPLNEVLSIL